MCNCPSALSHADNSFPLHATVAAADLDQFERIFKQQLLLSYLTADAVIRHLTVKRTQPPPPGQSTRQQQQEEAVERGPIAYLLAFVQYVVMVPVHYAKAQEKAAQDASSLGGCGSDSIPDMMDRMTKAVGAGNIGRGGNIMDDMFRALGFAGTTSSSTGGSTSSSTSAAGGNVGVGPPDMELLGLMLTSVKLLEVLIHCDSG